MHGLQPTGNGGRGAQPAGRERRGGSDADASVELARELKGFLLGGREATEDNLRQAQAPYVLTLISHGIYQDGVFVKDKGVHVRPSQGRAMGLRMFPESLVPAAGIDVAQEWDIEESMHRSALALIPGDRAQANSRQDGWLTGEGARELRRPRDAAGHGAGVPERPGSSEPGPRRLRAAPCLPASRSGDGGLDAVVGGGRERHGAYEEVYT